MSAAVVVVVVVVVKTLRFGKEPSNVLTGLHVSHHCCPASPEAESGVSHLRGEETEMNYDLLVKSPRFIQELQF